MTTTRMALLARGESGNPAGPWFGDQLGSG
jgi:hypothetical protein